MEIERGKGKGRGRLTYKKNRKFSPPITIGGINISGSDVDEAFISFSPGQNGKWVILSEIPLRTWELPQIEKFVVEEIGATITAIHNHWVVDGQPLLYFHFQLVTSSIDQVVRPIKYLWGRI